MRGMRLFFGRFNLTIIMYTLAGALTLVPAILFQFVEMSHMRSMLEKLDSSLLNRNQQIIVPAKGLLDLRSDLVDLLENEDDPIEAEQLYRRGKLIVDRAAVLVNQLEVAVKRYQKSPAERHLVEDIGNQLPVLKRSLITPVELRRVDWRVAESYLRSANETFDAFSFSLISLVNLAIVENREAVVALTGRTRMNNLIVFYVTSASIVIALMISLGAAHSISRPIVEITNVIRKIAGGNVADEVPYRERHDEIGELANAALKFQETNTQLLRTRDKLEARNRDFLRQTEDLQTRNKVVRKQAKDLSAALAHEKELGVLQRQFVSTMSHEIRTPLNGVLGMADLMLRSKMQDKQRRYMQTLIASARTLLTIINEILDFSKIESGKLELSITSADMRDVVYDVADTFFAIAAEKSVGLIIDFDWNIPSSIRHDPERMRQILSNLVSNALKFTDKGYVLLSVKMIADDPAQSEGRLEVSVADSGIGMTPEQTAKIFKPFVQADGSTARKYGGTGLGLTISRQLIELMGGEIGIESQPGVGSRFFFTLSAAYRRDPNFLRRELGLVAGARLLLVHSHEKALDVFTRSLISVGIPVDSTTTAKEALKMGLAATAQNNPYGIVLVDQFLPDLNSGQLARAMRTETKIATPQLALLAHPLSFDETAYKEFDVLIDKPLKLGQAIKALASHLTATSHAPETATAAPSAGSPHVAEAASGPDATRNPLKALRVLLAEDDPINQLFAQELLLDFGCEVTKATNGEEAIAQIKQGGFDIILMDCMMPIMDGLEATRIIRQKMSAGEVRRVPIIALTANAAKQDRQLCLEAGMDDYVSKPFDGETLLATLKRWTDEQHEATNQGEPAQPAASRSAPTAPPDVPTATPAAPAPAAAEPAAHGRPQAPAIADGPGDAGGSMPVIDWDAYQKTQIAMKNRFDTLLDGFIENTATYIGDIARALERGDVKQITLKAHSIKSSSRILGATRLSKAAEELEAISKQAAENSGLLGKLNGHMAPLQTVFSETSSVLKDGAAG